MNRKQLAGKIVEESIVLLKNEDHVLPFRQNQCVAFFGRTQIETLYSGNGSGTAHAAGCETILEEAMKCGITPEPHLREFYEHKFRTESKANQDTFDLTKLSEMVNSGIMYELFGRYHAPLDEYDIPEQLMEQAREKTNTAVFVIGRNSGGEECDRHLHEDYTLTAAEEALIKNICSIFENIVVILNVNGLIDLSWISRYPNIKGLLFLGIPGEAGAGALANILCGQVNPSGKMAVTVARCYEDYPSAEHFSWDKEHLDHILDYKSYGLSAEENGSIGFAKSPVSVYKEDLYTGYRYFDTFGKKVLYPFGYGLSYTTFEIKCKKTAKEKDGILVRMTVDNTGFMTGKEVVQVYLSKKEDPDGLEHPEQELKGFTKTEDIAPGRKEIVDIRIPWRELAVYDEALAAWIIEKGEYLILAGNSSRNTTLAGRILVEETILWEACQNRLRIAECNRGKVAFLSRRKNDCKETSVTSTRHTTTETELPVIRISQEDLNTIPQRTKRKDNSAEQKTQSKLLSSLTLEELASLCVGYGPGTPFAALGNHRDPSALCDADGNPITTNSHPTGHSGYVSPAIEEKGILSVFYKDGPAGTGGIAWPVEMLIACSFNRRIWRMFGEAAGKECAEQQVNVWLAPAVNLHRNPLCGRNFEYFSEDPYLTGVCACEIAKGVQSNHQVIVCPKHFAANEQETFRRGNAGKHVDAADSILTERAARELYLKPFEMLVKEAEVACIMTSFNKINGTFAGGNSDLCTHILREEWGFEGAVVTDWGDMDIVVDGADAIAAGNDIVMPGGPPVIRQILKGYQEGRVSRQEIERAAGHLLDMIHIIDPEKTYNYSKRQK